MVEFMRWVPKSFSISPIGLTSGNLAHRPVAQALTARGVTAPTYIAISAIWFVGFKDLDPCLLAVFFLQTR